MTPIDVDFLQVHGKWEVDLAKFELRLLIHSIKKKKIVNDSIVTAGEGNLNPNIFIKNIMRCHLSHTQCYWR